MISGVFPQLSASALETDGESPCFAVDPGAFLTRRELYGNVSGVTFGCLGQGKERRDGVRRPHHDE